MKTDENSSKLGRTPIDGERMVGDSYMITPDLKEEMDKASVKLGMSKSEFIRQAVQEKLKGLE